MSVWEHLCVSIGVKKRFASKDEIAHFLRPTPTEEVVDSRVPSPIVSPSIILSSSTILHAGALTNQ